MWSLFPLPARDLPGQVEGYGDTKMSFLERRRLILAWFVAFGLLAAAYLVVNFGSPDSFGSVIAGIPVMVPVLWAMIAGAMLVMLRFGRVPVRDTRRSFIGVGMLLGFFHVAGLFLGGLAMGFGESPMSNAFPSVVMNLFYWTTMLAALELGRTFLQRPFAGSVSSPAIFVLALFFAFLALPWRTLVPAQEGTDWLPVIGGVFLPMLAKSILAGALVVAGGPLAAMAYMGATLVFEWHSPILPRLDWVMQALIGTTFPLVGLLLVQTFLERPERKAVPPVRVRPAVSPAWILTGLACCAMIVVAIVPIGIRPISIGTGSMAPYLDTGDLVLVRRVAPESIVVGDVIQFRDGNETTIHRVIDLNDDPQLHFVTQGDANPEMDEEPVMADQVIGKVTVTVPKLGWVAVWMRQLLS